MDSSNEATDGGDDTGVLEQLIHPGRVPWLPWPRAGPALLSPSPSIASAPQVVKNPREGASDPLTFAHPHLPLPTDDDCRVLLQACGVALEECNPYFCYWDAVRCNLDQVLFHHLLLKFNLEIFLVELQP